MNRWIRLFFVLSIGLSFSNVAPALAQAPLQAPITKYDLAKVLDISLRTLTREPVRKLFRETFKNELQLSPETQENYRLPSRIRELTETQFTEILLTYPQLWSMLTRYVNEIPADRMSDPQYDGARSEWKKKFIEFVEQNNIKLKIKEMLADPLRPLDITPEGEMGWSKIQFFANHKTIYRGRTLRPSDLQAQVIKFIKRAKKEIVLNVFDFDLVRVAKALITRAKQGVQVRVGIDAGVIKARPEVKAIYDMLSGVPNLLVHAVDSVGLNHQKLIAIDWSIKESASTILLSGNLTQSCIGKEGDGIQLATRPKFSIPNANHMLIVDSQPLALVVNHEISKTIDIGFRLRGSQYPLGGAYKIRGPLNKDGTQSYMMIAFTPGGGLGDVNRDMIAQVIRLSDGPIYMVQFAASSQTILDALYEKMKSQVVSNQKFEFHSIADTPFAMADWSLFMKMSGLAIATIADGTKRWVDASENPWMMAMNTQDYQALKDQILVAPDVYGHHLTKQPDGTVVELTSKIHHKIMVTKVNGRWVSIQGSYNFSQNALNNQEYITIIVDPEISERMLSIYKGLASDSKTSVQKTAEIRNKRRDDRPEDRTVIRDSESENVVNPRNP